MQQITLNQITNTPDLKKQNFRIVGVFISLAFLISVANAQVSQSDVSDAASPEVFETVVKETKFNSSSRIVIEKEEIEKSKARSVTSLLAAQANISIAESNFTPTSIYLRGGDSSHVLILVDGMPFYDASSIQRTINLNSLNLKSIERIEVIKGSQSVLYGGQALTGVIKIETIPRNLKTASQLTQQVGTQNQTMMAVGTLQAWDNANQAIVVRGSYSTKESRSPVLDSKQVYPTRLGTAELAYVNKNSYFDSLLKAQTSFDKTLISTTAFPAYSAADADNFVTSNYQVGVAGQISLHHSLKPKLSVAAQDTAKLFEQDSISSAGFPTKQDYKGQLYMARLEVVPYERDQVIKTLVGLSTSLEKMTYTNFDTVVADVKKEYEGVFYKVDVQASENILVELGERLDFLNMKQSIHTMQLGFTLAKVLKLEYATGLKRPSLFQAYSSYGNPDLKTEESTSYSAEVEQNITSDIYTSVTYFENTIDNLIIAIGNPQRYENVTKTNTKGVEATLGWRLTEQAAQLNFSLGYQEPKDLSSGEWLVKRPLRTASLKVRKDFNKSGFGVEMIHNGDRRDKSGSASYSTIGSYSLVNLVVDYKPSEPVTLFSRLQNIFNQRYESSYSFYNEGLSATAGVQYDF